MREVELVYRYGSPHAHARRQTLPPPARGSTTGTAPSRRCWTISMRRAALLGALSTWIHATSGSTPN